MRERLGDDHLHVIERGNIPPIPANPGPPALIEHETRDQLCRQGDAQEVPLGFIAVVLLQEGQLSFRLDPFSDHPQIEAVRLLRQPGCRFSELLEGSRLNSQQFILELRRDPLSVHFLRNYCHAGFFLPDRKIPSPTPSPLDRHIRSNGPQPRT